MFDRVRLARGVVAGSVAIVVCLAVAPVVAVAQGTTDESVRVAISPLRGRTIAGVALLHPTGTSMTAVEVLATGAPVGTLAVIHPGSCDDIRPDLVALLGDVGGMVSLQVTIPLSLASLTDGSHVLALHEGLEFATAIACGIIPAAVPAPSPIASFGASQQGGSYASPRYGFSLTWDAIWHVSDEVDGPPEGVDRITLESDVSTIIIAGYPGQGRDALACITAWEEGLFAAVRDGSVSELAPLLTEGGDRVAGGDAAHAWAAYRHLMGQTSVEIAEYRECWQSAGGTLVELSHLVSVGHYAAAALTRQALLATLVLPAGPPPPTPPPAPTTGPDPTVEPVPTPDPACEGVNAWVEATTARLDRIVDIRAEADRLVGEGDVDGYKASIRRFPGEVRALLVDQQGHPVPPLARAANEAVVQTYEHFIVAGDSFATIIGGSASTGLYERFQKALKAAEDGDRKVRGELGELAGRCP